MWVCAGSCAVQRAPVLFVKDHISFDRMQLSERRQQAGSSAVYTKSSFTIHSLAAAAKILHSSLDSVFLYTLLGEA